MRRLNAERPELVVPKEAQARFMPKIAEGPDGCIVWTASTTHNGYGHFWFDGRSYLAHRLTYEWAGNAIPEGHELHHVCENRLCVNPEHLVPMSRYEHWWNFNSSPSRQNAEKTHCKRGHPFDEENTSYDARGHRRCLACGREWHYRKKAEARNA